MSAIPAAPEAKLWELLRRNKCFRKTVARLAELDAKARTENTADGARWVGERMVERFTFNSFAQTALRWLVPNPLFLHRKLILPPDFDESRRVYSWETVRLGRNFFPEEDEGEHWQWFDSAGKFSADSIASLQGWPQRWGPTVEKVVTDEPRIKPLCRDDIAAWRDYFANRKFDLSTPWAESPPQFQRAFSGLWSLMLGDSFGVHETDYFKGRNVAGKLTEAATVVKLANQCIQDLVADLGRVKRRKPETVCPPVPTKGKHSMRAVPQFVFSPSGDDMAKMFHFDDLARKRVFAVPHVLRRSDAKKVVEDFRRQLIAQLPDDHELLGTGGFWETCIAVEKIEHKHGLETGQAIGAFIRRKWGRPLIQRQFERDRERLNRWFKNDALSPAPSKEQRREHAEWLSVKSKVNLILREVDRSNRSTVRTRVNYIRKLSAATFPRLNLEVLTALPPHKSNKPK